MLPMLISMAELPLLLGGSLFLAGVLVGLAGIGVYHVWLSRQITRMTGKLQPQRSRAALSNLAHLKRAIARSRARQRELDRELSTWQAIAETAPIGFLQIDLDNQLVGCNRQASRLLGIPWAPFGSSSPRLLLEWVRSYELDELIEQTRRSQHPCQMDWTWYPVAIDQAAIARQQPLPLRGYGIPLRGQRVAVFLEDRREAVLLTQQRDRWTSDVAHELKTPLTSIRLVAEMLQIRLEPPLQSWADKLLGETLRLSRLVQDLLDLSRLESQTPQAFQPVDLVQIIHAAWASLDPLARKKAVEMVYDGPIQLMILGDSARLHRVLLNLLDNGLKYSPSQQVLQVCLHTQAEQVELTVRDAGPGFAPEDLPFVFERFYRSDPARSRLSAGATTRGAATTATSPAELTLPSGSGLGLAIVRQIVEAHQGSVAACNHGTGPGAEVTVKFPTIPPQDVT